MSQAKGTCLEKAPRSSEYVLSKEEDSWNKTSHVALAIQATAHLSHDSTFCTCTRPRTLLPTDTCMGALSLGVFSDLQKRQWGCRGHAHRAGCRYAHPGHLAWIPAATGKGRTRPAPVFCIKPSPHLSPGTCLEETQGPSVKMYFPQNCCSEMEADPLLGRVVFTWTPALSQEVPALRAPPTLSQWESRSNPGIEGMDVGT